MHKEILTQNQIELLDFVSEFKSEFYLVGGTAISLHIGHRYSIDFDFFKKAKLDKKKIYNRLDSRKLKYSVLYSGESNQIHVSVNNVKLTFFEFPYKLPISCKFENYLKLPDLLTLSAMKAFALGRRAKWKDYVDLFFILKYYFSFQEICFKANEIFGNEFSEKQFRAQISFFNDIDKSEEVEYLIEFPPTDKEIETFLLNISLK